MQINRLDRQQRNASDHLLAQAVLNGNMDAFTGLYERYEAVLSRFVSRSIKDKDQADDIVQQVFFKLYLCLPTLRTDTPLKPWLCRVAYHYCIDYWRHTQQKPAAVFSQMEMLIDDDELSVLALLPDTNPLPEEVVESQEVQHLLCTAIHELPSRYRPIVVLRFFGQHSFAEISRMLTMPENTVKTYFHRAKRLLRVALIAHPLLAPG